MKPKYSLFKNSTYAFQGIFSALRKEASFRRELLFIIPISYLLYFKNLTDIQITFLIFSFLLILIVELLNSAIESTVDLCTEDYHELAKNAKDYGAAAVLLTISMHVLYMIYLFL